MKIYTVVFYHMNSGDTRATAIYTIEKMKSFTTFTDAMYYSDQFNAEQFDGCEIIESELE
jgi:hypothetical protein